MRGARPHYPVTVLLAALTLPGPSAGVAAAAAGPRERPDIVLIVADDMGYSDIGCYGSEIPTPNLDRLGYAGVRFSRFSNHARCCPTRASLMTGLYPHQTGMGHMTHNDTGHFGYRGELNFRCVTIAEVLRSAGYATYMSGKWHLTTDDAGKHQCNWPCNRGFDRFYGMVGGAGSYYAPHSLARGNRLLSPPEGDYNFTDAITDEAVGFLREHPSEKPYFLYLPYTAPHWPLHASEADIARFRGAYREGWDAARRKRRERQIELGLISASTELTPRDPRAPAWEDVKKPAWQQRRMEVYAAQVHAMDRGVGRVIRQIESSGRLQDTLIFFLSDNGGCAEVITPRWRQAFVPRATRDGRAVRVGNNPRIDPGPEDTYQSYGPAWANVSNTPYRLYKHWTHEGGVATPLIMHWPRRTGDRPGVCDTPGHLPDIMATCVAAADATYPQSYRGEAIPPCEGIDLSPALRRDEPRRNGAMFWEHEGNRAVRRGDWKLVARHGRPWELYDTRVDRSEMDDLADQRPGVVAELSTQYDRWALRAHVLPWPPQRVEELSPELRAARRVIAKRTSWSAIYGDWELASGELRQTNVKKAPCRALLQAPAWGGFVYELEAKKTAGEEGFLILFNCEENKRLAMWNIGGWRNTQHALQAPPAKEPLHAVSGAIEAGRWYRIRLRVTPDRVQCYLDDELVNEFSGRDFATGRVGVGSWRTAVAYRRFRLTGLDGKVLYQDDLPDASRASPAGPAKRSGASPGQEPPSPRPTAPAARPGPPTAS